MKSNSQKTGGPVARNQMCYMVFERFFVLKKGNFGAELGTFQQGHVAKTIIFTLCLVDFGGVTFAPKKWTKWSKQWVKMAPSPPDQVQIVQIITHPVAQMIEKRLPTSNLQHLPNKSRQR